MTNIFYVVTTKEQVGSLRGREVLHDYTGFTSLDEAIAHVPKLETDGTRLVGKLEAPDEIPGIPDQIGVEYLTQLGYNPKGKKDKLSVEGIVNPELTRQRMSVVPWNKMQRNVDGKYEMKERLERMIKRGIAFMSRYDTEFLSSKKGNKLLKDGTKLREKMSKEKNRYFALRNRFGFTLEEDIQYHRVIVPGVYSLLEHLTRADLMKMTAELDSISMSVSHGRSAELLLGITERIQYLDVLENQTEVSLNIAESLEKGDGNTIPIRVDMKDLMQVAEDVEREVRQGRDRKGPEESDSGIITDLSDLPQSFIDELAGK